MPDNITKQNIKYYDAEASVYDESRYMGVEGQRIDRFQKQLLADYLKELPIGANVLEFGCGTGRFLTYLAGKGCKLTGIDISPGMLEQAHERVNAEASQSIRLLHSEAEILPFDDADFNAVYSILVINLIPNYQQVFKEISRVVKPGGLFVLSVPNLSSIYFPAGMYVNLRGKTTTKNKSGHRYSHWFSRSEIKKALNKAGFSMEKVVGQSPTVRYRDGVAPISNPISRWFFSKSVYIKARRHV